ncbi:MAG: hypothetical protein Q9170_000609 [Blastenia crenularia]
MGNNPIPGTKYVVSRYKKRGYLRTLAATFSIKPEKQTTVLGFEVTIAALTAIKPPSAVTSDTFHLVSSVDCAVMDTAPIKEVFRRESGPTGHFPVEAEIVGYLANSWSVPMLLGLFAAGWVVILGTTNTLVKRHNPALGTSDKAAILWFVLSESDQPAPVSLKTMLN